MEDATELSMIGRNIIEEIDFSNYQLNAHFFLFFNNIQGVSRL